MAAPGTPEVERLVTQTPWLRFLRDTESGTISRGGGNPTPGSLVLNKVAVGGTAAYGAAFISDLAGVVSTNGTQNPELTQRIYRYNLQPAGESARQEMTSLVTLKQMQTAVGTTSNTTNLSRQVTLGTDASTLYFIDSSNVYGGLWSVPTNGGSVRRLFADPSQSAEPSVTRVNGVDRVHINGTAATNNAGGLDYYDTSTGNRVANLAGAALADFLQTTVAGINISSTAADDAGNVYFNTTSTTNADRRGIYKLDPQGRLIKVVSYAERKDVFGAQASNGNPNSNTLRMQTRAAAVNGIPITQVMYVEQSGVNAIAAANVFLTGDFDRDADADAADLTLFKSNLTVRNAPLPSVGLSRYDLNGNHVSDWKDVKVLQSFLGFETGDLDLNFAVDFADLETMAGNYLATSGQRWTEGDVTGDDAVAFDDLLLLVGHYDAAPAYPTLNVGGVFTQPFVDDYYRAIGVAVPEPASLAAVVGGAFVFAARRRRREG